MSEPTPSPELPAEPSAPAASAAPADLAAPAEQIEPARPGEPTEPTVVAPLPRSPAYGAERAGTAAGTANGSGSAAVVGAPDELGPPGVAEPPRRSRVLAAAVIGLAVVLVVAGAVIAGAFVWFGWGTTEPEAVLPGSSVALVRADFAPGLGQKLAVGKVAAKFPASPGSGTDSLGQVKQALVDEVLPGLNYGTDIAPWLGDRVGAAAWMPAGGRAEPCVVVALASKDDAVAKSALAKVPSLTYAFSRGYAVLSQCRQPGGTASDAVAAARSAALVEHAAFSNALDRLPSGQTVVGWVDLGAAETLAQGALGDRLAGSGVILPSVAPTAAADLVVGVRATGDGVELRMRVHVAGGAVSTTADALARLGALPANSTVGLAADLRGLQGAPPVNPGPTGFAFPTDLPSGFPTDFPGFPTDFPGFPTDFPTDFGTELPDGYPTDFPTGVFPTDLFPTGLPSVPGGLGGSSLAIGNLLAVSGLLQAVLGSVTSLSVTDVAVPEAKVVIQAADNTAARNIANTMTSLVGPGTATVTVSGQTVNVASTGYRPDAGPLTTDPIYRQAMAGGPARPYLAAYVNVDKLAAGLKLDQRDARQLAPVKAIGLSIGTGGGDIEGLIRVVVG